MMSGRFDASDRPTSSPRSSRPLGCLHGRDGHTFPATMCYPRVEDRSTERDLWGVCKTRRIIVCPDDQSSDQSYTDEVLLS